jgi:hypothetical protein
MPLYYYARELLTTGDHANMWNIDNPNTFEFLANSIELALPNKKFKVICNDSNVTIDFEIALSTGEHSLLTMTFNDYKLGV